ncbi:hypothetical protein B566_EDAN001281 [Ephemera danica]|nr:hypothetical protein B566_EDAN001281 [Ephemera danica]
MHPSREWLRFALLTWCCTGLVLASRFSGERRGLWRPYWRRRALVMENEDPLLNSNKDPLMMDETITNGLQTRPELAQLLQSPDLPAHTKTFLKEASDEELARFLNLLTVVRFANTVCEDAVSGLRGVCYSETECSKLGGDSSGDKCARGFGVCCVCFPLGVLAGNEPEVCWLKIERSHPLVTQLRLDFEVFELAAPTSGNCDRDQLLVSGQDPGSPIPPLCGVNNGQHVYIEVGSKKGPISLSVILVGPPTGPVNSRRWRIRVTQLTARDTPLAAPSHCLQYYTQPSGVVQSFNYLGGTGYTNNLNYAICIRKGNGICSVTYRNYDYNGTQFQFQLVNVDGGQSIVPPNQAGAGVFNCPDDYIVVSGVRLCGEKLNDATRNIDFTVNAPVTDSSTGPFILPVRTNGAVTGRGFSLSYTQNACQ